MIYIFHREDGCWIIQICHGLPRWYLQSKVGQNHVWAQSRRNVRGSICLCNKAIPILNWGVCTLIVPFLACEWNFNGASQLRMHRENISFVGLCPYIPGIIAPSITAFRMHCRTTNNYTGSVRTSDEFHTLMSEFIDAT